MRPIGKRRECNKQENKKCTGDLRSGSGWAESLRVKSGLSRFTVKLQVLWKNLNNKVVGYKKICNFNIYIFSPLLSPDVYTSSSTTLNNPLPDIDLS